MSAPGAVLKEDSSIAVVAASARAALGAEHSLEHDAPETLPREDFNAPTAAEKARGLPGKMRTILAAGLVAWVVVAIPAWLLFG
ncbi:hypothetical protein [Sphingomonas cavernae]|uniref:Uncharacterized protein n=1 Tax=Sphingomonas cavernae TaxID=2320861 RepID=A0A418W6W9_9SPHN|nr:hypothetical protein [Sphingomonas cavernae]RJF85770.1 hypothetical protein D3876_17980 [Sphingomonas cavernae]